MARRLHIVSTGLSVFEINVTDNPIHSSIPNDMLLQKVSSREEYQSRRIQVSKV